ncbi:hypothetical protein CTheo_6348 [Ceratobasidium theobromae]|uniref:Uncharacterized protein n=1 Tax=Ceratobasidium theobromae TaxID=1582974 RepID=A0A5N5QFG1_9AGAM|nr:hypothetical protein CTheo_6348 [Ceratobasidium theobromae]
MAEPEIIFPDCTPAKLTIAGGKVHVEAEGLPTYNGRILVTAPSPELEGLSLEPFEGTVLYDKNSQLIGPATATFSLRNRHIVIDFRPDLDGGEVNAFFRSKEQYDIILPKFAKGSWDLL